MDLSGENYDDKLEVENEEDLDSADDENTNYEVEFPYEQAELQGVDDYRAQGEEPSDSDEKWVTTSRWSDWNPWNGPTNTYFLSVGILNHTTNHRLKGLTVEEDQEEEEYKGLWTGEDQGLEEVEVYKDGVKTRGGRRGESPKVPKFLLAVSTKDIDFMAPNVEWKGSIGNSSPNVEHNSPFDYFKFLTDDDL